MSKTYKLFQEEQIKKIYNMDIPDPRLVRIALIENGKQGENILHAHNFTEIFYFISGKGNIIINNHSFSIHENELVMINPNNIHKQYSDTDTPLVFYSIYLENVMLHNTFLNNISSNLGLKYSFQNDQNSCLRLIQSIVEELSNNQLGTYQSIQSLTKLLFIDIIRLFYNEKNYEKVYKINLPPLAIAIKDYINANFTQDITLDSIVKQVYASKNYIIIIFKKYFGMTPIKYINQIRINEAKKLLKQTNKTISEIATLVGFNNPSYFADNFFKITHETPRNFRNN